MPPNPDEFPLAPDIPEINPGKNSPQPSIIPETPPIKFPIENPDKKNPPEIEPEKVPNDTQWI